MQNINLLSALAPRSKRYLTGKQILLIALGWWLLLMLIYGINWGMTARRQATLNSLLAQQQFVLQQITIIEQEASSQKPAGATELSAQLSSWLATKQNQDFVGYLVGLAKAIPQGVWLTSMDFSSKDNSIILRGNARSASLIPVFLSNLGKLRSFVGKQFTTMQVTKVKQKDDKSFMAFELSTKVDTQS